MDEKEKTSEILAKELNTIFSSFDDDSSISEEEATAGIKDTLLTKKGVLKMKDFLSLLPIEEEKKNELNEKLLNYDNSFFSSEERSLPKTAKEWDKITPDERKDLLLYQLEQIDLTNATERQNYLRFLSGFTFCRHSPYNRSLQFFQSWVENDRQLPVPQSKLFYGTMKQWSEKGYRVYKGSKAKTLCIPQPYTAYYKLNEVDGIKIREYVKPISADEEKSFKKLVAEGKMESQDCLSFANVAILFHAEDCMTKEEFYTKILPFYEKHNTTDDNIKVFDALEKIAKGLGYSIKDEKMMTDSERGYINIETKKIAIAFDSPTDEKISVLAHELTHGFLHTIQQNTNLPSEYKLSLQQIETQAGLGTYCICENIGVDAEKIGAAKYVLNWSSNMAEIVTKEAKQDILNHLDVVLPLSDAIGSAVKEVLEKDFSKASINSAVKRLEQFVPSITKYDLETKKSKGIVSLASVKKFIEKKERIL